MRRLALLVSCAALAALPAGSASAGSGSCPQWKERVVASGLGVLENLEFDGRGTLFLSANTQRAVLRMRPDGSVTTAVADVGSPGGMRVRNGFLFFNTGDSAQSGLMGIPDGTIQRLDLDAGGPPVTYSSGLTMPNGLVFLPNGDAVTSRDLGTGTRLTRVPAKSPTQIEPNWAGREDHNGLAVDTTGTFLYADETFVADSGIWRIRIARPAEITRVAKLSDDSTPEALDDMTIDNRNVLWVTAQGPGSLVRVNPLTGAHCTIATGLRNPSAVKFGSGPGWSSKALYVTGFDGTVRELSPPPGYRPIDARPRMTLKASPSSLRAGVRTRVTFTARAFGGGQRGAIVNFAGRAVRTDSRGRGSLTVRVASSGKVNARVTKRGFRRTVLRVPVR